MALNRKKLHYQSLGIAALGFAFVVILLNFMNGTVEYTKKKAPDTVQFEPKKVKKQEQKIQKKQVEKKQANKVKSLKPKMNMAFASSGLDLGIDILGLSAGDSKLLSQAGDTVMTEDVVDRVPQAQSREPIPYPESAKEQNIEGHVTVSLLVNKDGNVDQVKLLDSAPEGVFDQAALRAVKTWTFSPAEYKGQFVAVWVTQKLKFKVN